MIVSVVIATYRRNELLARCLHALDRQLFPADEYEAIVCDDAADDHCRTLVETFAAHARMPVRYIPVSATQGPAAARNRGWQAARGEIIAFTDDDTIPDARWLTCGIAEFTRGVVGAWGRIQVPIPPHPTDYQRDIAGLESAECATANCFYLKDALARVGGFDERFETAWREDADLFFRMRELGHVIHVPQAMVVHPVRSAHFGVSIGQQRKAMFNALLYKKHRELYRERIQAHAPRHYYAMVAAAATALALALAQQPRAALIAAALWLALVLRFAYRRLRRTSRRPGHVLEMLWTSAVIPPLSVFWRLRGALKYRVLFW